MSQVPLPPGSLPPFLGSIAPQIGHPKIDLLAKVLRNYDLERTVAAVAGMFTVPSYQANAFRLEILVHIAVSCCDGKTRVEPRHLDTWLNRQLGVFDIAKMEDPAEDAFVLNVLTSVGDFRVFPGLFEGADAATTYLIAAVGRIFDSKPCPWLDQALALLALSDAVAQKSGLQRWAHEPSVDKAAMAIHSRAPVAKWAERVTFTPQELKALGIAQDLLEPFFYDLGKREGLVNENSHDSALHYQPLVRIGDKLVLALPASVTYAVRKHLVTCAAKASRLGELHAALMNQASHRVVGLSLHGSRHGAELVKLPAHLRRVDQTCSSAVVRVGERRFLHHLLVSEDIVRFATHGLKLPMEPSGEDEAAIAMHTMQLQEYLEKEYEVDSGHTLYIAGLLGQGIKTKPFEDRDRWTFSVARLSDLELLYTDSEYPLDRLILLLNQLKEQEDKGLLHIPFDNGLLNLYSYWVQQNFTLRVPEAGHSQPLVLQIATDHLLPYRLERRRLVDEHCEPLRAGFTVVQRANYASIYRNIRGLPVYVSLDLIVGGVLAFCVHAGHSTLWVVVLTSREALASKTAFELWEALQFLVYRAVQADCPTFETHSPEIVVDFRQLVVDAADFDKEGEPHEQEPRDTQLHLRRGKGRPVAFIEVGAGFMQNFGEVENKGEQSLLATVLRAMWALSTTPEKANEDFGARALEYLGGPGARVMHTLRVSSAAEHMAGISDRRVYTQPEESIRFWLNSAFIWRPAPGKPEKVAVDESSALLNEAVTQHAAGLQGALKQYNRVALISELLTCYETMLRDKQRWKATARAVRSLYGPEEALRAALKVDQERAQTQIAMRALIEAATCECKDAGGLLPDGHRIDDLVGRMAALTNMGRDSDALHFGLASQGITIYPNGSYVLAADVLGQMAKPFLGESFGGQYEAAARDYESWFRREPTPVSAKTTSFFNEPKFQDAWLKEYGLTFTAFREIAAQLEDTAVERGAPVVTCTIEEIAQARKDDGITVADVRAFLDSFGLPRRPTWLAGPDIPAKFVNPWRFERPLSLSLRPLVVLDAHGTQFTYGIAMAREAFGYVLDSIKSASFDKDVFKSTEMRAWLGGRVDELGREFTEMVAEQLRALGWQAKTEVAMTQLGALKKDGMGDVDVLAWKDGRVLIVECKRLKQSRTVAEIALACDRFKGNVGDKLHRHLRRFAWLQANQAGLAKFIGHRTSALKLQGPLVVSRAVPFKYLQGLPIAATEILQNTVLQDYIASSS
ncbi:MAG TPA: hypothetical protein VHA82_10920 [Ramlibacter sp.]|uniref:hypothetical protein n=1 Tax=Ramlibacter sp. TaxID=1917967 RepID=UPI002C86742B|nr:hypothetical protein [Ramlibacter sp.]HVZ44311.1 hypothetical protein [Ramlibacter sp.]